MRPSIICTVTTDLSHDQRMQRIAHTLATNGYAVTLVGRQLPNSSPLKPTPYRTVRLRCGWNRGKLFYLEYNIRLFFFLRKQSFTILNSVDADSLLAGFLATRFGRKKWVFDAHEWFSEVPELARRPFTKKIWQVLENQLVPRVDVVYTVSATLAEKMTQQFGRSFAVIRNVARRQPLLPKAKKDLKKPIILYQGALNAGRGLEALLVALKQLPKATLWLAGEGDLSTDLRRQIKQLGLTERVRFFGYVAPDDLRELTQKATIGYNLLHPGSESYYYSLANKTFDYIQAEIPALHPPFPEYHRLLNEFPIGLTVPGLMPEEIATSINEVLNQPDRYQRMVDACRRAKADLCWENEAIHLLNIYHACCPS